jgi:hypothetical protein
MVWPGGTWGRRGLFSKSRTGAGSYHRAAYELLPAAARLDGKGPGGLPHPLAPEGIVAPSVQPARHLLHTCIGEPLPGRR